MRRIPVMLFVITVAVMLFFRFGPLRPAPQPTDPNFFSNTKEVAPPKVSDSDLDRGIMSLESQTVELEKVMKHPKKSVDPKLLESTTNVLQAQQSLLKTIKEKQAEPYVTMLSSKTVEQPLTVNPLKDYMPIIVTGVLGLAALVIVLGKSWAADAEARKWAFGVLGVIIGYWLKT